MRVISGKAKGIKLNSIDSLDTRPTLDRVKESLFNIINNKINEETEILDLFAGSGSIGIEFISRGAKHVCFCEKAFNSADMILKNLEKTKFLEKATLIKQDYKKALKIMKQREYLFDVVYIDPPFKKDIGVLAAKDILKYNLLKNDGIIILETDDKERELKEIESTNLYVYDLREYGRISLIFMRIKI